MGALWDLFEQAMDDAEETISDAIDAFGEWAEPIVDDFRENNPFTPKTDEERKFQKELKEWKEETYGPENRVPLSKALKARIRRKFDKKVDPDSDLGKIVHKVRQVVDREEEKKKIALKQFKTYSMMKKRRKRFGWQIICLLDRDPLHIMEYMLVMDV